MEKIEYIGKSGMFPSEISIGGKTHQDREMYLVIKQVVTTYEEYVEAPDDITAKAIFDELLESQELLPCGTGTGRFRSERLLIR